MRELTAIDKAMEELREASVTTKTKTKTTKQKEAELLLKFLDEVEAFVERSNFDYPTIAALAELKNAVKDKI